MVPEDTRGSQEAVQHQDAGGTAGYAAALLHGFPNERCWWKRGVLAGARTGIRGKTPRPASKDRGQSTTLQPQKTLGAGASGKDSTRHLEERVGEGERIYLLTT